MEQDKTLEFKLSSDETKMILENLEKNVVFSEYQWEITKINSAFHNNLEKTLISYLRDGLKQHRKSTQDFLLSLIEPITIHLFQVKSVGIDSDPVRLYVNYYLLIESIRLVLKYGRQRKSLKNNLIDFHKGAGNKLVSRLELSIFAIFMLDRYKTDAKFLVSEFTEQVDILLQNGIETIGKLIPADKKGRLNSHLLIADILFSHTLKKEHELFNHREKIESSYNLIFNLYRAETIHDYLRIIERAKSDIENYGRLGHTERSKEYSERLQQFIESIQLQIAKVAKGAQRLNLEEAEFIFVQKNLGGDSFSALNKVIENEDIKCNLYRRYFSTFLQALASSCQNEVSLLAFMREYINKHKSFCYDLLNIINNPKISQGSEILFATLVFALNYWMLKEIIVATSDEQRIKIADQFINPDMFKTHLIDKALLPVFMASEINTEVLSLIGAFYEGHEMMVARGAQHQQTKRDESKISMAELIPSSFIGNIGGETGAAKSIKKNKEEAPDPVLKGSRSNDTYGPRQ